MEYCTRAFPKASPPQRASSLAPKGNPFCTNGQFTRKPVFANVAHEFQKATQPGGDRSAANEPALNAKFETEHRRGGRRRRNEPSHQETLECCRFSRDHLSLGRSPVGGRCGSQRCLSGSRRSPSGTFRFRTAPAVAASRHRAAGHLHHGYDEPASQAKALDAGAVAYLTKPFPRQTFLSAITRAIHPGTVEERK